MNDSWLTLDERERENVKEVSADLPEQYLGGKCWQGPSPENERSGLFHRPLSLQWAQLDKVASVGGRCGNVHVRSRYGEIEKRAGREGREGWFLPLAFHYFLFPINASISGVSKQHRANRNESGASRHALAAISVVHLVVHTSCHHGQRESFAASVFLKQRVFVIYLARLHGGWSRLGDFILCFTLDGWAMFGGKWGKRNNCEK